VEVVIATPDKQVLRELRVEPGSSVADVLRQSNLAREFPQLEFEAMQAGIWGRPVERDQAVSDGDRVELYRPLNMDPREARRRLAAAGRTMGSTATKK
jgi:putative ubiquitin-RnfH superfamily antitoxin RatB of RatAB toxin-antitoxin module